MNQRPWLREGRLQATEGRRQRSALSLLCRLSSVVCHLSLAAAGAASGDGYHLVENFTAPLHGSGTVKMEVDTANAKVGLAAARLTYTLTPKSHQATLQFSPEAIRIPGPGQLRLWVKPDAASAGLGAGQGDELQLSILHAEPFTDDRGRRHLKNHVRVTLPRTKLDFAEWRELAFDLHETPPNRHIWLDRLDLFGRRKTDERSEATLLLDDLRLYPAANAPPATLATRLIGPAARDFGQNIAVSLDARSFVPAHAKVRARLSVADRNESVVADRDFDIPLPPSGASETRLELAPDKLDAYLPPFTITCDIVSADLPQLSTKTEHKLVMANSVFLFDDMSDPLARWFTAGYPGDLRAHPRSWVGWAHGEAQRASAWTQTTAAVSRVEIPDDAQPATRNPQSPIPPGRFALRAEFTGDAAFYCGRERLLPGNAFRLGVWVKGDGGGAKLSALVLDYTDAADFWEGGWKRIYDAEVPLCTLDFTDWRYIEVPLPGNGLGSNNPRGSTEELDFPLELTAFRIEPPKAKEAPAAGSVLIGPIVVHTQQEASGTLALHAGYDDPEHHFDPKHGAWVTVQNASPARARSIRAAWALLDRANDLVAKGQADLKLAPREAKGFRIDLARDAPDAARRQGPLRLQIVASDAADAGVAAARELILAKPDSVVALAAFECDRGYLGLKALSLETAPPPGEPAARTSTEQAHTGRRSLALSWDRAKVPPPRHGQPQPRPVFVASVDPPLPGVPTEVSLWLHGDASGVLFYPIIGDSQGVSHGGHFRTFDLFLARSVEPPGAGNGRPLQSAVRVDWQGWRQLSFRLPIIPPGWDKSQPVLAFVPSYPLGLHLAIDPADVAAERGTIFVDDISVRTHLPPEQRLGLSWERADESNVLPPGAAVQVSVANHDAASPRKAVLACGIFDWRGRRIAGADETLELKPGEVRPLTVAKALPIGAYALRLRLTDANQTLAALDEDLVVGTLEPILGGNWLAALRDEWKLRVPINDRYEFVDEDWDWVEHYPGNLQLDSVRQRAGRVAAAGGEPYVLLGYSAYWAAGIGLEQLKAGAFQRRQRDAGHAVDTFLMPERDADWDHYACELMRGVGREVAGFVLWNGPDTGALAVPPERFAKMLASAGAWRSRYCPATPLLIGGLSRASAIPYLQQLAKLGALDHATGANVRLDVGRLSPEDARVAEYARQLREALASTRQPALGTQQESGRSVLLTDLDWAVEKGESGLGAFDQAAYLIRSDLLLHPQGIRPALAIRNDDCARLGLGLTYRRELAVPPLAERPATLQLKPAWWGVLRARQWLGPSASRGAGRADAAEMVEVQDTIPGRTQCLALRRNDGRATAIVWRNDDGGELSFAHTGLAVEAAEDAFGSPVPAHGGRHLVGKVPVAFTLREGDWSRVREALGLLWVSDGGEPAWPQRVLAVVKPAPPGRSGGVERFAVPVAKGAGLVLRARFILEGEGFKAEVVVNGQVVGVWNLTRSAPELSGGEREAIFVVPPGTIGGKPEAVVELKAPAGAKVSRVCVLEYRGGDFPLSAVGAVHIAQNIEQPRLGRNVVGGPLAVGRKAFANGIGTFANCLLEFPLNRQFARFSAQVGVDAVTEGKGSVVFEVYADGRKLWASPVMSGLDAPRALDLEVKGVDRLRLVVTDAGDGNASDAANWCEPTLYR